MTHNLITRWFGLWGQRGLNKSDAVRQYNATHGTAYSYHRFREFEVGDRPPPHEVAQNLRRDVLPDLIDEVLRVDNATDRQIHDLLVGLSPPPIKSTIAQ